MSSPQRLRVLLTDRPTEVSRELVRGHLHEAVALDHGDVVKPVGASDLEVLALTATEASQHAHALLARTSAPNDVRKVDTLPGLRFVVAGDGLAASRLALLPQLLDPMPLGGIVAAVPGPDQLLCVPLVSARSLDALQTLASALGHAEASRDSLLSDQLFWFDGDTWRPIPVHHGDQDITVLPPADFVEAMNRLASMDLVSTAGEA
jgi:hypothetical protein